jgi:hypothetical protein
MAKLVASVLDNDEEPLAASPATSYHRSPDWDPARAAAIREQWHRFVRRVLDLK